jgi:hypothetical protein
MNNYFLCLDKKKIVSECKKLYYCRIDCDTKKGGLVACLVGNQTRGSQVALTEMYEGWDWSTTKGNQASPPITRLKRKNNIDIKKQTQRLPTRLGG